MVVAQVIDRETGAIHFTKYFASREDAMGFVDKYTTRETKVKLS